MVSASAPDGLDARLRGWLERNSARLYLPSVSVAEIVSGIEKARRNGAFRRAVDLEAWLRDILHFHAGRTLSFDVPSARLTGALLDRARSLGLAPGFADLAIAGIALANDLTVLTRNLRHFAPLGVPAHDPYASLPG